MLTTQDFVSGVDFTGVNPLTGGDLNDGHNLAVPVDDGFGLGRGIVIATIDSALNTPVVPNANATVKWKRYLWRRVPHASAADQSPLLYAWSDNAIAVATYLKWIQIIISGDDQQHIVDNTADILAIRSLLKDKATVSFDTVGTDAPNALIGINTRAYNHLVNYNTAIFTGLDAVNGLFTCNFTGNYTFNGWLTGYVQPHRALITNHTDGIILAQGSEAWNNGLNINTVSNLMGIIPMVAGKVYKIQQHFIAAQAAGFGKWTGIVSGAANVYMTVTFERQSY